MFLLMKVSGIALDPFTNTPIVILKDVRTSPSDMDRFIKRVHAMGLKTPHKAHPHDLKTHEAEFA
jgi:hypothetical protein